MTNQESYLKNEDLEIDLIDYFRVIWRRKITIFLIIIVILVMTVIITFLTPPTYQSSIIIKQTKRQGAIIESTEMINMIIKRGDVLENFSQKLNFPISAKQFKLSAINGTIEIQVFANSPEKTKKIAEVIADYIIQYENKVMEGFMKIKETELKNLQQEISSTEKYISELEEKVKEKEKTYSEAQARIAVAYANNLYAAKTKNDELKTRLSELEKEMLMETGVAEIKMPANLPRKPIKPNKLLNILIGAILGIFVSIFWAFLAEYWEKNKDKLK